MSEKKRPNRTSDEEKGKQKIDGKEGLERLADFARRILHAGRTRGAKKHAT